MSMTFRNTDMALTTDDIAQVEAELGLAFPLSLSRHYIQWNGGSPDPYVYEDEHIDTVVADVLPLKSLTNDETAVETYRDLVLEKQLVPRTFFPFAADGGGDYFFADCSDPNAQVYFFDSEKWFDDRDKCLVKLPVDFDGFFASLKPE